MYVCKERAFSSIKFHVCSSTRVVYIIIKYTKIVVICQSVSLFFSSCIIIPRRGPAARLWFSVFVCKREKGTPPWSRSLLFFKLFLLPLLEALGTYCYSSKGKYALLRLPFHKPYGHLFPYYLTWSTYMQCSMMLLVKRWRSIPDYLPSHTTRPSYTKALFKCIQYHGLILHLWNMVSTDI